MTEFEVLQPGVGPIRTKTYLPAEPGQLLWGRLPCETATPVLTIDPATDVTIDTISHEGVHEDQGRDPVAFFARFGVEREQVLDDAIGVAASDYQRDPAVDGPHVITGPIRVEGAKPGDLLKISILETLPRVPYGIVSNRHAKGALPGEYPADGSPVVSVFAGVDGDHGTMPRVLGGEHSVRFPLRPFLGIQGVAVRGNVRPHSVPPGPFGGNIDVNLMTAGSVLYLPVQVDGALAYAGDPHFAQGDGEVALTAMEASLRATLRYDVLSQAEALEEFGEIAGPLIETAEFLVPTGMDEDLDEAMRKCVRAALALLQARFGMDAAHAYAYLSAATDFNISQVVDIVKGVHARIRVSDFD